MNFDPFDHRQSSLQPRALLPGQPSVEAPAQPWSAPSSSAGAPEALATLARMQSGRPRADETAPARRSRVALPPMAGRPDGSGSPPVFQAHGADSPPPPPGWSALMQMLTGTEDDPRSGGFPPVARTPGARGGDPSSLPAPADRAAGSKRQATAAAAQPSAKRRGPVVPHPEDETKLADFKATLIVEGMNKSTADNTDLALRKFSAWLSGQGKPGLTGRLNDPELWRLVKEFGQRMDGDRNAPGALKKLQTKGGVAPGAGVLDPADARLIEDSRSRNPIAPHPEDETKLADFKTALIAEGVKKGAADSTDLTLRRFSAWLSGQGKPGLTGRLNDPELGRLVKEFGEHKDGDPNAPGALKKLQARERIGPRIGFLHPADARLINDFRSALEAADNNPHTQTAYLAGLKHFSIWLDARRQPGFAGRLDDPSLDRDLAAYLKETGNRNVSAALKKLKDRPSPDAGIKIERHTLTVPEADSRLFAEYHQAATARGTPVRSTVRRLSGLRSFSDWLRRQDKTGIAGRLHDHGLTRDLQDFTDETQDRSANPALTDLRKISPGRPADPPSASGGGDPGRIPNERPSSSFFSGVSRDIAHLSGGPSRELRDDASWHGATGATPASSSFFSGASRDIANLSGGPSHDLRDDASWHGATGATPASSSFFSGASRDIANLSGGPSHDLRDDASWHGATGATPASSSFFSGASRDITGLSGELRHEMHVTPSTSATRPSS